VPAAVYCFLKYPGDFPRAVLAAVNAGDAAASIGALTGSFVGLLSGAPVIRAGWANSVEDSDVLTGVGENLAALVAGTSGG
ncbi:MAG: ADP-ribosylglycohydrolase family protein, partial [Acidobacteria bacterium]|nr:ADP-ribosylglycohydrolase family protein [Acidobacteriota bacterium]